MRHSCAALCLALTALSTAAQANDTAVELAAGGLEIKNNSAIEMAKERLIISIDEITVEYEFRNITDQDVTTRVAFPMPDIQGSEDADMNIPSESDNFLGFSVSQDGKPLAPELEQRAFVGDTEITADLRDRAIPMMPRGAATSAALAKLPHDLGNAWDDRGITSSYSYNVGNGEEFERTPLWRMTSAYHWETTFPAGKTVKVTHSYRPVTGGTSTISLLDLKGAKSPEVFDQYVEDFCVDDTFVAALRKRQLVPGPQSEASVTYILGTGANWAGGRIRDFTLEVDKGHPGALVSFCGDGVEKISPTRFRLHQTDYAPPEELHVLFIPAPNE